MNTKSIALAVLGLSLLVPSTASAALIAKDTFNASSVGGLQGQSGGTGWSASWVADALFQVQSDVVPEGSKAARVTMIPAYEPDATRAFPALTVGTVSFHMGKDGIYQAPSFSLRSGDTWATTVFLGSDVQQGRGWFVREGGTEILIAPYTIGTFGEVTMEFDTVTDQYRVSIDGAPYTQWFGFITPVDSVDTVWLRGNSSSSESENLYWDKIVIKD
ncbi:MAG: hypothetical protein WBK28_01125 [Minisyncoccia bacterium]